MSLRKDNPHEPKDGQSHRATQIGALQPKRSQSTTTAPGKSNILQVIFALAYLTLLTKEKTCYYKQAYFFDEIFTARNP